MDHMKDVCHCKMRYEESNLEEYEDYYDYSLLPNDPGAEIVRDDGIEIELANGKIIGHRILNLYYKQNIRPSDSRACVLAASSQTSYEWMKNYIKNSNVNKNQLLVLPLKSYNEYTRRLQSKKDTEPKRRKQEMEYYRKWTSNGVKSNKLFKPCCQTNV